MPTFHQSGTGAQDASIDRAESDAHDNPSGALPAPTSLVGNGADAFDAIVQAANPAHPDHAAWRERYGGSLRTMRKSLDGAEARASVSNDSSTSGALRRSRSRTANKSLGTGPRSRPSLDSAMMRSKLQSPTQEPLPKSTHGPRAASEQGTAVRDLRRQASNDKINGVAKNGLTPAEEVMTDKVSKASSSEKRRKRKEKGKRKAPGPPVPPPRTTSHAAMQEHSLDSPTSPQYGAYPYTDRTSLHGTYLTSPTHSSRISHSASNSIQSTPNVPFTPQQPNAAHASFQRLAHSNSQNFGFTEGYGRSPSSHNLASPEQIAAGHFSRSDAGLPPFSPIMTQVKEGKGKSELLTHQSSKPLEGTTDSQTNASLLRTMFAPSTSVLANRRSIDFRLPDEEQGLVRQTNRSESRAPNQRKGLDTLLGPFRSVVSGKRADKQNANGQAEEPKVPTPILRQAQLPECTSENRRKAPTPPPRSPLRGTMSPSISEATEDRSAHLHVDPLPLQSPAKKVSRDDLSMAFTGVDASQKLPSPAMATGHRDVHSAAGKVPTSEEHLHMNGKGIPKNVMKAALGHTQNDSVSGSAETEEGEEFHDARSDEGGNGSSSGDGATRSKPSTKPVSPSNGRRRRSRHKSMEALARPVARDALWKGAPPVPATVGVDVAGSKSFLKTDCHESSASDEASPTSALAPSATPHSDLATVEETSLKHEDKTIIPKEELNERAHPEPFVSNNFLSLVAEKGESDYAEMQQSTPSATEEIEPLPSKEVELSNLKSSTDHVATYDKRLPAPPQFTSPGVTPRLEADLGTKQEGGNFQRALESERLENESAMPTQDELLNGSRQLGPTSQSPEAGSLPQHRLSSIQGGGVPKRSGLLSRIRRDRTPSQPHLHQSDSHAQSLASVSTKSGSQTNLPRTVSNESHWAEHSTPGSVGLGIDSGSNPVGPDPFGESRRRPSHDGGWRTRLPSFSANRTPKNTQSAWQNVVDSTPPLPPLPTSPSQQSSTTDEGLRKRMLYDVITRSFSDLHNSPSNGYAAKMSSELTPAPPLPEPDTIHKTLSPALLTDTRHEADEVGSFIGSSDAEEERLADSRRGTWKSYQSFELDPNKKYPQSPDKAAAAAGAKTPIIDVQQVAEAERETNALGAAAFIREPSPMREASRSASGSELKPLSMTARRISRSASNPKLANVPKALDLSTPSPSKSSYSASEFVDDSKMSPFVRQSPGESAFPASPTSNVTFSPSHAARQRNLSIGSTLLGGSSGVAKGRTSFAADRDRSPVVNQIWTDLPPSPSPNSSAVRRFFASGKGILRPKNRTASNGALRSPYLRAEFEGMPSPGLPQSPSPQAETPESAQHRSAFATHTKGAHVSRMGATVGESTTSTSSMRSVPTTESDSPVIPRDSLSNGIHARYNGAGLTSTLVNGSISSAATMSDLDSLTHSPSVARDVRSHTASPSFQQISHSVSSPSMRSLSPSVHSGTTGSGNATMNAASERDAFDRLLRARAKEDAQRIRQIAQKSVSNACNVNVNSTTTTSPAPANVSGISQNSGGSLDSNAEASVRAALSLAKEIES